MLYLGSWWSLREKVLKELHGSVTAGHFGIAKTHGCVQQRFYWVNCQDDVREWCRNCDVSASSTWWGHQWNALPLMSLIHCPAQT